MTLRPALIMVIISLTAMLTQGCIVVKYKGPETEDIAPEVTLSPRPDIEMSETLVRSHSGDMIAFLPEGWFFVDVNRETPSDIFAFAVNRDYTLGAAFLQVTADAEMQKAVEREGLFGLARMCMFRHKEKTANAVNLAGKYTALNLGELSFATFDMTNADGARTKSAVFISSSGRYYQISIIPLQIMAKPAPPDAEVKKILRSILTTVQY